MHWLQLEYGAQLGTHWPLRRLKGQLSHNSYGKPLSTRSIATICETRIGVSRVHALRRADNLHADELARLMGFDD
jgi:hypothetical protein